MGRYVLDVLTSKSPDEVEQTASTYLSSEGFEQATYGDERVWKMKGHGTRDGGSLQFVTITPTQDAVHLEAWIKFGILPRVYVGEIGTVAIFGRIPMQSLVKRVERLGQLLA